LTFLFTAIFDGKIWNILTFWIFFKFVEKSKLLFNTLISQDFWQINSTHFDISNFANFLDFSKITISLNSFDDFWREIFFRICSFYFCKVVWRKFLTFFFNRTFLTEKLELFGNFVFSDILRFCYDFGRKFILSFWMILARKSNWRILPKNFKLFSFKKFTKSFTQSVWQLMLCVALPLWVLRIDDSTLFHTCFFYYLRTDDARSSQSLFFDTAVKRERDSQSDPFDFITVHSATSLEFSLGVRQISLLMLLDFIQHCSRAVSLH